MNDRPIYTDSILASNASSREKLLLITLATAQNDGKTVICLSRLSSLTSTSIRHLSRIISKLEQEGLLQVTRRPGRCNSYSLPFLSSNSPKAPKKQADKGGFDWKNPELIKTWQSIFSQQYQPVNTNEQKIMDFMIFSRKNGRITQVNHPVAYLKTLAKNGYPSDFPSFSDRQKSKKPQKQVDIRKKQGEEIENAYLIYTKLSKSQQKKIKNKFKAKYLPSQPRQVVDIFNKNGFKHQITKSLFRSFVCQEIGHGA